jgi:hypothetical protein
MNGFGYISRETGHSRDPAPPHRIVGISYMESLGHPLSFAAKAGKRSFYSVAGWKRY